jgi:dolichyldiphosphatase
MFAGQLACEAVNFALKRLIKEERPKLGAAVGKGYGMPSSHAQFAVFWAVAVSLFLLVRHRPRQTCREKAAAVVGKESSDARQQRQGDGNRHGGLAEVSRAYRTGGFPALNTSIEAYAHASWTLAERAMVSACALLVAGLVAWSRVYLGYHTVRQVLAGCAAGAGCAAAWFAATYLLRETGALAWALELPPARWFRVRDLVVTEDLCQAGWEKWEERRRMAQQEVRQKEREKEKKIN